MGHQGSQGYRNAGPLILQREHCKVLRLREAPDPLGHVPFQMEMAGSGHWLTCTSCGKRLEIHPEVPAYVLALFKPCPSFPWLFWISLVNFKQGISLLKLEFSEFFSVFSKDFVGSVGAENPW